MDGVMKFFSKYWKIILIGVGFVIILKPIRNFLVSLFNLPTGIFSGITNTLGITDSEQTKNLNNEIQDMGSPFKPQYWKEMFKQYPNLKVWNNDACQSKAKEIYNLVKKNYYLKDTEIIGCFSEFPSQSDVSKVAEVFQANYKKELLTFMTYPPFLTSAGISEAQASALITYVKKLKHYRT